LLLILYLPSSTESISVLPSFFLLHPFFRLYVSHRSSFSIYFPVQRAYPSFLLFSFYTPFTALMLLLILHLPSSTESISVLPSFSLLHPFYSINVSHCSSFSIYLPVQRAYPSFLLFSFYTPFTGYMCHIAPCFLFFQIPLSAISILPFFFLSLHPITVYDVPLCSSFSISPYTFLNTAQRAFSSCLPLSLSTLLLQY